MLVLLIKKEELVLILEIFSFNRSNEFINEFVVNIVDVKVLFWLIYRRIKWNFYKCIMVKVKYFENGVIYIVVKCYSKCYFILGKIKLGKFIVVGCVKKLVFG